MTATLATLPIWKKDATPADWLQEVAAIALVYPERFSRIIVVYEQNNPEAQPICTRMQSYGFPHNTDIMGALETAKCELWDLMKNRQ